MIRWMASRKGSWFGLICGLVALAGVFVSFPAEGSLRFAYVVWTGLILYFTVYAAKDLWTAKETDDE